MMRHSVLVEEHDGLLLLLEVGVLCHAVIHEDYIGAIHVSLKHVHGRG